MSSRSSSPNRIVQRLGRVLGPLLLITICPPLVMLVWFTNVQLDGSVQKLFSLFAEQGFFSTVYGIWSPLFFGTVEAWKILAIFAAVELFLMKALPGRKISGPVTPFFNVYILNGYVFFSFIFIYIFLNFKN